MITLFLWSGEGQSPTLLSRITNQLVNKARVEAGGAPKIYRITKKRAAQRQLEMFVSDVNFSHSFEMTIGLYCQ